MFSGQRWLLLSLIHILAAEQLQSRNHSVQVEVYPEGITAENAEEILAKFDVIVDASDNFPTRYLLSDTCMKLGKPDVYGACLLYTS